MEVTKAKSTSRPTVAWVCDPCGTECRDFPDGSKPHLTVTNRAVSGSAKAKSTSRPTVAWVCDPCGTDCCNFTEMSKTHPTVSTEPSPQAIGGHSSMAVTYKMQE